MTMKSYSLKFDNEKCACARVEGVDASYKDLAEVCGRIRGKDVSWAILFLEKATKMEIPVLYKKRNKRLGHRRELGGKKGRYPEKATKTVLKVLKSAIANGRVKGLGTDYSILHAAANKKDIFPRIAAKGRRSRQYYVTTRIEVVLKSKNEVPKGVEVTPPPKKVEKPAEKKEEPKKVVEKKTDTKPAVKKLETPKEHKHAKEKAEHHEHKKMSFEHSKGKKTEVKKEG